ncbi:MAG: UbiD family decarboxylase [Thermococci archaeon]|nr:UbiD family decarboxylase [Thermococci archaeon]
MIREILNGLDDLIVVEKPVSPELDITRFLLKYRDRPVLFKDVSGWEVVGNLWSSRERIARALNLGKEKLVETLLRAMEDPKPYAETDGRPGFMDNRTDDVALTELPIPKFYPNDGGRYVTSGVVIARDRDFVNVSFHRMMVLDDERVAVRLVPRHLYSMWRERYEHGEELDVRVVIGAPIEVLLGGATSVAYGVSELEIASSLKLLTGGGALRVKDLGGIPVPAESEFVFEARITSELADEGPFVDITGTYDEVRKQPVMVFERMYHVDDPVFHTVLPGGYEHFMLMGLPKEPQIYASVKRVVPKVHGVRLTEGGCMWLHAVVSITKQHEGDGKNAILAAFAGHPSLKHVVVVDGDVDIYDDREVEWAVATRFQADRDLVVIPNARGSSLDPSAERSLTAKWGIDATKPMGEREKFEKVTLD